MKYYILSLERLEMKALVAYNYPSGVLDSIKMTFIQNLLQVTIP
jgi:hypothetical protein